MRRVEDREAIHALFMRYRQCLDEKDFSSYAALFATDGEFVAVGATAKGRAGIEELVDGMRGSLLTAVAGDDLAHRRQPRDLDRRRPRDRPVHVDLPGARRQRGADALAK